jgi:hypothetical protein
MQGNKRANLLTKADEKHISQMVCDKEEQTIMSALTESSKVIDFSGPNEFNWLEIQRKIKPIIVTPTSAKKLNFVPSYLNFFAVAASTIFVAMGWLVWSNHQLHNQLEQVLLTNQQLELKLVSPVINTYEQVFFVKKLNDLDQKLQHVNSLEQKVMLLQKRSALVLELYKTQQGVSNVFSI